MMLKLLCLLLPLVAVSASPIDLGSQKDYLVLDLPGLSHLSETQRPTMHAGLLPLNLSFVADDDTEYFFWRFSKQDVDRADIVFWLNGGPGCSSMDGALMELGPFVINPKQEVEYNEGTWVEAADVVFVDQPGGTGFSSTTNYLTELTEVADGFVTFLARYFHLFPADVYKKFTLGGESYAGQYVPYILKAIMDDLKSDSGQLPKELYLKGALIGNGWIDPNEQSLSYLEFFIKKELIDIHGSYMPGLLQQQEKCQNLINHSSGEASESQISYSACEKILNDALRFTRDKKAPLDQQCINMYDYTLRDTYPSCGMSWPPYLPDVTAFLQKKSVLEALHLDSSASWSECSARVGSHLKNKISVPSVDILPDLLQEIPIILFNGDHDIICNCIGTERMIDKLEFNGDQGFTEGTEYIPWFYNEVNVGKVISERNLTYVRVYNSSHMVPFDNTPVSRGLLDIYFDNFEDVEYNNVSGIATPVYDVDKNITYIDSNDPRLQNGPKSSSTDDSAAHGNPFFYYVFELFVIVLLLCGLVYLYQYYSNSAPHSILADKHKKKSKNKSKNVRFLDDLESNLDLDNTDDKKDNSVMSKLLSSMGYQAQEPYKPLDKGANADLDIEMDSHGTSEK
ncbi:Cell death protease [Komagataella phaffii CBS 7435]|nr:GQ67_00200T0 [Komagataella phaffii]AOA67600.1 GQ68_01188T0 [Komagataella phaffii GS115]CAH2448721.1 Cell death protease [Komagataella phaffii CBS 7435]CCA38812.1 Cell death protease [Komagataella phaffii CBS 7435]